VPHIEAVLEGGWPWQIAYFCTSNFNNGPYSFSRENSAQIISLLKREREREREQLPTFNMYSSLPKCHVEHRV
jgi:hypothetical protein